MQQEIGRKIMSLKKLWLGVRGSIGGEEPMFKNEISLITFSVCFFVSTC
jgi:hypothetical protein